MKLITIFFIFIVQTHGSWIGDFENVMSSLQSGFQKLMTDVVTDVKDTIDCTVVAVESVLSLGVNDAWYRKCKGVASQKPKEYKKDEGKPLKFIGNKHVTENLNHEVSKRLKNPLTEIEDKFRSKNEKLNSINAYLKSELENISSSFDDELKKIDKEEKSTVDSVVQYINKIHSAEHSGDKSSEEIRKILNGPSKTVTEKTNSKNSNNDKINNILTSLEHQSNNKNESSLQSTVSMLEGHNISKDERSQTYLKGFKDLFDQNVENRNQSEQLGNIGQNIANLSTHSLEEDVESMDKIFGVSSANSEPHKGMLEEAKNLLQESERSSSILNNLFQRVDQSGRNIFDNL